VPYVAGDNAGPIEIYYEEVGDGPPVVLIGGLTSTIELWAHQRPALAEHHRVIAPDNRGSGRTRIPEDDGVRTPARWTGDVELLLDALGLDRVHLVGGSMGGLIVQEFALTHPERLRSLAILCSTPGEAHGVPVSEQTLRTLVAGQAPDATAEQRRASVRAIAHPRSFEICAERLERYEADKAAHPHSTEEIAARQRGMNGWESYTRLPELRVPTLVMTGDSDVLVPPGNAEIIAARIPGAELVTIAEAGHVLMVEQPEAVNRALLEFFAKH